MAILSSTPGISTRMLDVRGAALAFGIPPVPTSRSTGFGIAAPVQQSLRIQSARLRVARSTRIPRTTKSRQMMAVATRRRISHAHRNPKSMFKKGFSSGVGTADRRVYQLTPQVLHNWIIQFQSINVKCGGSLHGGIEILHKTGRHLMWECPGSSSIRSSYSRPGTSYSSPPIDVIASVRTEKIVVLGGNGFVGSAIAKEAVERDIEVISLNRSGRPPGVEEWADKVLWISGDVFTTDWDSVLLGATAVISTLGGFGTQEQMERLNGDANVAAVNAVSAAGIEKYVMISVHDYNLPDFALRSGYFTGKRRAEKEVLAKYPETGTILRPAFIYGTRRVNGISVPLGIVGKPLEQLVARTATFTRPFARLPGSDVLLAPPVSVEDVARAALNSVKDKTLRGILDIEQIKNAALPVTAM